MSVCACLCVFPLLPVFSALQLYESIAFVTMSPAAQEAPAEEQEYTV